MNITIDLNNFSTYISSGRISNIFKSLTLKDIKIEDAKILSYLKKNKGNDFLNYESIIHYTKIKIEELNKKRKYDNDYYFSKLVNNFVNEYVSNVNLNTPLYLDDFLTQKNVVLENHLVQEKIFKLKKLKEFNQ